MDKIELLAPAGSFDALTAAIQAGADAVYFGVEQLNMRARSVNSFLLSDIKEISSRCRKNKIRSYITLNTILYDHDMQLLKSILKEVKKQKIDAVIASDIAVIESCNQMKIPVHISTQSNVSNIEAVKFYARFADVVVLARELTLKQVEGITREIKKKKITGFSGELLKIEAFVHGALCMAISGKCYLSLHSQNASANRGACIQNCRHSYTVTDTETKEELVIDHEYIMSPKDLCTLPILDQVLKSGVNVLKIEGRTKGADYVHTVTRCYREALDAIRQKSFTQEKIDSWMKELATVYNRGFWEGYYLGQKQGQWSPVSGSAAIEKKIYIGKGTKYYPKIKIGEFLIEAGSIKQGDTLMITGANVGLVKEKLDSLVVNGAPGNQASKGDKITLPVTAKITSRDKIYKVVSTIDG
jgi:putative protease